MTGTGIIPEHPNTRTPEHLNIPTLLLLAALLAAVPGCAGRLQATEESALAVEPQEEPGQVRVALRGPAAVELDRHLGRSASPDPARAEQLFYLAVWPDATGAAPVPMTARYRRQPDGRAYFLTPAAPLTRGQTYLAVFDGPRLSPSLPRLTREHAVPDDGRPSGSRVAALYPNGGELPANLLKFYLHFTAPMAEGKLFRHVRLLDEAGEPVDQAFREVELWAEDHRRVTLWINPGRTKQELGLSEALGPVLEPGRRYTLELLPGLPDQQGRPLEHGFRHAFLVTAPDREQPRIEAWELSAPAAGGRGTLVACFPEPMDHALASRVIGVEGPAGEPLEGEGAVSEDGRRWSFTPAAPWSPGSHALVAGGELEDLAGNSLYRAFETEGPERRPVPEPPLFRRPFTVAGR
jgi:hypothetical protein